jgi:hypothetical protein
MLSLEVVDPGDGLSTAPSQAVTATAAYSCTGRWQRFFFGWGTAGGGGGGGYRLRRRWDQDSSYSFICNSASFQFIQLVSFINSAFFFDSAL